MSKVPSVVLFRAFGRELPALVLASRDSEVSHLGAEGEPLLTLAVPKVPPPNAPYKRLSPIQANAPLEVEIVHDVVHASHEFSEDFKREKNISTEAHVADLRGHGEWTEYRPDFGDAKVSE